MLTLTSNVFNSKDGKKETINTKKNRVKINY